MQRVGNPHVVDLRRCAPAVLAGFAGFAGFGPDHSVDVRVDRDETRAQEHALRAALPRYPTEITEAGWKKALGASYAKLEKQLKVGIMLATLEEAVTGRHLKVFDDMHVAIKSKEGGKIKLLYCQVSEVLDHVERLERLASGHQKMCKSFASDLQATPPRRRSASGCLSQATLA